MKEDQLHTVASQAVLLHNGEIARKFAQRIYNFIETSPHGTHNTQVEQIFDWFSNSKIAKAELRDVIHQKYGRVGYFSLQMLTISGTFAYLRGYFVKSGNSLTESLGEEEKVLDVLETSSTEFLALKKDRLLLTYILSELPDALVEMLPNLPGNQQFPSHFDEGTTVDNNSSLSLSTISESDWSRLQQILLSTSLTDGISAHILNKFDLHPSLNEITFEETK